MCLRGSGGLTTEWPKVANLDGVKDAAADNHIYRDISLEVLCVASVSIAFSRPQE